MQCIRNRSAEVGKELEGTRVTYQPTKASTRAGKLELPFLQLKPAYKRETKSKVNDTRVARVQIRAQAHWVGVDCRDVDSTLAERPVTTASKGGQRMSQIEVDGNEMSQCRG